MKSQSLTNEQSIVDDAVMGQSGPFRKARCSLQIQTKKLTTVVSSTFLKI